MEKTLFTHEYSVLLRLLKETRRKAKITQIELAKRLGESQSFVSKCERGERRIDSIELRTFCHALDTTLPSFTNALEKRLKQGRKKKSRR